MSILKDNVASVASLKLLPKDDISAMPELNLQKTETTGAVATSAQWTELDFSQYSAVLKQKSNNDGGFNTVTVELTGNLIEETDLTIDDLNKRYIADAVLGSGKRLLLGTYLEPLTLEMEHDTGNPSKGSFAKVRLSGVLSRRSPEYVV